MSPRVTEKSRVPPAEADDKRVLSSTANENKPVVVPSASPRNPDPEFDAALQRAQQKRSHADGDPRPVRGSEIPHQVKSGDTLYGIAQEYRAPFPDVLKANKQFKDPARIHPGDVAFVPNSDPRVVRARNAVAGAHRAEDAVISLESMARDPKSAPAARKMANMELPATRNATSTAWSNVEAEVEGQFRALGAGKPYPEEVIRPQVEQLKASLPNDPKVRQTVDDAYRNVTDEWRKQGWTRDTLGTIVAQYEVMRDARNNIDTARSTGSVNLPQLEARLSRERTSLQQEIERQLDSVTTQIPPEQREMAIGARAALIEQHGSNELAFNDLVDQATYNKVVQPGVDAVRNAYQSGGAKAAAETLRQQTENVSPETAERIVAASLLTIESVAVDMTRSLTKGALIEYQDVAGVYANIATAVDYAARGNDGARATADVARIMVRQMPSEKFQPHVADSPAYPLPAYQDAVMQSVSSGTGATLSLEMTAQLKESGRNDEAESLMGATQVGIEVLQGKIEDDVKKFGEATAEVSRLRADWTGVMSPEQLDRATIEYVAARPDLLPNFDRAHNTIDGLGYGAARTSLALSAALPRLQGLPSSERLTEVRNGFVGRQETQFAIGLSDKASNEVLRIMLGEQAGVGGPNANPNSSVSGTRGFVKELGNALMTSQPSSSSAMVDLGAGTTTSIPPAGATTPSGTVRDIFGTGQDVKLDPKKATFFLGSMNGLGAVFNGYQAALAWDRLSKDPTQLLDATKAVYYTIGAGKETAELLAVGAQRGWLGLNRLPAADQISTSILAKANRTGLALEPGWVKFSTYFKIGGGALDTAFALDAAAKGDWISSGLYTTSASGGFLLGAGSVASSGGWLATWGGPVGAGLVLASALGLYMYNDSKDKARFEGPSREFLEMAGYKPEIAEALSDYSDNDGGSAGPALAATAQQFGVTPEQLMERLNRMDPDKVRDLVDQAHTVDQDARGQFPLTAVNDRNVWGPPGKDPELGGAYLYNPHDHHFRGEYRSVPGSWYPARIEDPNPRSMTALRDYVRVLFGEPVLG